MPIELPAGWIVVLNVGGWLFLQLGLAWAFAAMPVKWFDAPGSAHWEKDGRVYERIFRIKRWKDRLPDAADWFGGVFAKAALAGSDPAYWQRFVLETWRGELCHWAALGCAPIFFLWNPWWGDVIIAGYALLANMPCILAQRYNRARFQRLLLRRSLRTGHRV